MWPSDKLIKNSISDSALRPLSPPQWHVHPCEGLQATCWLAQASLLVGFPQGQAGFLSFLSLCRNPPPNV